MTEMTDREAYCEGSPVCTLDECPHKHPHKWTQDCIHDGVITDDRDGSVMRCPDCLVFPVKGEFLPMQEKGSKYSWDVSVDLRGYEGKYEARITQKGGSRSSLYIHIPKDLADILLIDPGDVLEVHIKCKGVDEDDK